MSASYMCCLTSTYYDYALWQYDTMIVWRQEATTTMPPTEDYSYTPPVHCTHTIFILSKLSTISQSVLSTAATTLLHTLHTLLLSRSPGHTHLRSSSLPCCPDSCSYLHDMQHMDRSMDRYMDRSMDRWLNNDGWKSSLCLKTSIRINR